MGKTLEKELCLADISASTEAAFWARVKIDWCPNACWLWQPGAENIYGRLKLHGTARRVSIARIALALQIGRLPRGIFACHTCDTPLCVRPDHLFPGTAAENMADQMTKGRHAVGEKGGAAKLTEDQVRQILACTGTISARAVGALFGVKKSTVNKIRSGVNWKHLAWQK